MKSIKQIYRIGVGPSSSHTMGPTNAVEIFKCKYPDAQNVVVTLFGSLALTGKGHGTDVAITNAFAPMKVEVVFDSQSSCVHPNTMVINAESKGVAVSSTVCSIGGGEILFDGRAVTEDEREVYSLNTFEEIKKYCNDNGKRLWQYVEENEEDLDGYLKQIYAVMQKAIADGLKAEGVLNGGLGVVRRAKKLLETKPCEDEQTKENRLVSAYAFAVSEQNASGGTIVTAPTCGSCGVLPAVFNYYSNKNGFDEQTVLHGLMTAGLVGNLVKHNASISGAECGCQAEIGTACAMTAAGLAEMLNMSIDEIEYSAEVALEHHLGLTCDPIGGLVQIPCIERNAVAAMRSINAVRLATFLADSRKISLDTVIATMYETGKDIGAGYRETALNGLAKHYTKC